MKRWIERALNIHPGDLGRGTLLCSCLFLVMTTYKVGGVAGAALFLSRFQAKQLAYADIASAVVVALVVAGYVLLARREQFVRTVRSECLDWLLILNGQHLERVLNVFVEHYNGHRPHRALALTPPRPTGPQVAPYQDPANAQFVCLPKIAASSLPSALP